VTPGSSGGHALRREVFVYWKLAPEVLAEAVAGTGTFQRAMALAAPGLQARLLVRCDDGAAATATLMETYALPAQPGGIGDALLARLRHDGDAATAPWRHGARHVEVFAEPPVP
jgi:hypothetical protein